MKLRERLFRRLVDSPRVAEIDQRKRHFEDMNQYIRARNGWMTSVPGDPDMRFEVSPAPRCRISCARLDTSSRRAARRSAYCRTPSSTSSWSVPTTNWSWRPPDRPGR